MSVATAAAPVSVARPMMGGRVSIHILDTGDASGLEVAATRVLDRMECWAARLTRFSRASELSRLNAATDERVGVGPTLAAVLDWGRMAEGLTDGIVDIALLDARLAAEASAGMGCAAADLPLAASRRWSMERGARGSHVQREPGVRFDLDGVAKGWLADRALALVPGRSALVDADGDIAVRLAPGDGWAIGIADPRDSAARLAVLELGASDGEPRSWGVATSGISVHRWQHGTVATHHLIDPRTGRPAATDVIQATAIASSAREAEARAKAAVILGSGPAFAIGEPAGLDGLLVLTAGGETVATPGMMRWLA